MAELTYSGPPFLSNIRPEIRHELTNRAIQRNRPITPFIKAIPGFVSGAPVGGTTRPIFKGIADQIEQSEPWTFTMTQLYRPENAYRPVAGITSLVIEYKNITGAVRKASLKWSCHSLNDLERLAPFFLNPGHSLLLEWGWSEYSNQFDSRKTSGGSQYVDTSDKYAEWALDNYYERAQTKVLASSGNYDAMLGIIVNYEFVMVPDGGFNCTTDVVAMGDLSTAIQTVNTYTSDANSDVLLTTIRTHALDILQGQLALDFEGTSDEVKIFGNEDDDVFLLRSKDADGKRNDIYMSWGYIEDNVINKVVNVKDASGRVLFKFDSRRSKIRTHEYLRTLDLDVCIIPQSNSPLAPKVPVFTKTPSNSNSSNSLTPNSSPTVDRNFGAPSFGPSTSNGPQSPARDDNTGKSWGSPRRILISSAFYINCIAQSRTLDDAIAKIFGKVSDSCCNIWRFSIKTLDDKNVNKNDKNDAISIRQIVDLNFTNSKIKDFINHEKPYTFRIKSFSASDDANIKKTDTQRVTSIIRNISLASKLSNDAALNVFYSTNTNKKDSFGTENAMQSLWNYKGSDVFIGKGLEINSTENARAAEKTKQLKDAEQAAKSKEKVDQDSENENYKYSDRLKAFLPLKKYNWNPQVGFKVEPTDMEKAREIMRATFYKKYGDTDYLSTNEALVPMGLEIELEGISGIRPGDCFLVDNVPESYKQKGVFQVVGLSQEITRETWKTKLKAHYRIQRQDELAASQGEGPVETKAPADQSSLVPTYGAPIITRPSTQVPFRN